MRIAAILVLLAAGDAIADEPAPPAPLTLADLVARQRWNASLAAVNGLDAFGLASAAGATYAVGDLELFGDASIIAFFGFCIEGCHNGDDGELAVSNLRAGARYMVALGPITIAPALTSWLPTTTADSKWWPRARAVMTGARDSRAFLDEPALGGSLDAAWRGDTAFAQTQVGTALVADGGPQIDNVFVAVGAGTRVSRKTSLVAEWRVDAYPREPWLHAIGAGISRGDGNDRAWRLRLHVVRAGSADHMSVGGASLAFDLVQQW